MERLIQKSIGSQESPSAEANTGLSQASGSRHAARYVRLIPLMTAAAVLAVVALVGIGQPASLYSLRGVGLVIVVAGAFAGVLFVYLRVRRTTNKRIWRQLDLWMLGWLVWEMMVFGICIGSGWWKSSPNLLLLVAMPLSVLPLLLAAWLLGQGRQHGAIAEPAE